MKHLSALCFLIAAIACCNLNAQEDLQNTSWMTYKLHADYQPQVLVNFDVDTIHAYGDGGIQNHMRFLFGVDNEIFWMSDVDGGCLNIGTYTYTIENDTLDFTVVQDDCDDPRGAMMNDFIFVRHALSIPENNSLTSLVMYPNPATDRLIVKREKSNPVEIRIFDQTGRIVIDTQSEGEKFRIDLDMLSSGIYYVLFKDGSATMTNKLMVIPD